MDGDRDGQGRKLSGDKTATWGIFVGVAVFSILTIPMTIPW